MVDVGVERVVALAVLVVLTVILIGFLPSTSTIVVGGIVAALVYAAIASGGGVAPTAPGGFIATCQSITAKCMEFPAAIMAGVRYVGDVIVNMLP